MEGKLQFIELLMVGIGELFIWNVISIRRKSMKNTKRWSDL